MDAFQVILQLLILIATLYLIFFKSFFKRKGENLATKQDIGKITEIIESIKLESARDLESVKAKLSLINKRSEILLTEKIRAFLELQTLLNNCIKYCEARQGDFLGRDFHPTSESLPLEVNKGLLFYTTHLNDTQRNNYLFLSKNANKAIDEVKATLIAYCNMELSIAMDNKERSISFESVIKGYDNIQTQLKLLLDILYEELNNDKI